MAVASSADLLRTDGAEAALDALQRQRWEALGSASERDDFLAARVLVRWLVRAVQPHVEDVAIRQQCATCGGPHGRPQVTSHPDLYVSWSHASGGVAAVVSSTPVGVDLAWVDEVGPPIRPRTGGLSGWARWTRTEALVKRGDGELFDVRAWPLGGDPAPQGVPLRTLVPTAASDGVLTEVVDPDEGWIVSVAADQVARLWDGPFSL